jgi:hypothetical protein
MSTQIGVCKKQMTVTVVPTGCGVFLLFEGVSACSSNPQNVPTDLLYLWLLFACHNGFEMCDGWSQLLGSRLGFSPPMQI